MTATTKKNLNLTLGAVIIVFSIGNIALNIVMGVWPLVVLNTLAMAVGVRCLMRGFFAL